MVAPHKLEFKCMKAYQDGLGICEVKGRLEGGQEAGRNDVFVDEVWEADHATLPTWCTESTMWIKNNDTVIESGTAARNPLQLIETSFPKYMCFN